MIESIIKCDVCGSKMSEEIRNLGCTYAIKRKFWSEWEYIDICWPCLSQIRIASRKENEKLKKRK